MFVKQALLGKLISRIETHIAANASLKAENKRLNAVIAQLKKAVSDVN